MPHVVVKMYAGLSEAEKARIAEALVQAMMTAAGSTEASLSVAIEDVAPADWVERVYKPEILGRAETLVKQPGYKPA